MMYVTFYSHYGAICFKKEMENRGVSVKLMSVPRRFSSSCGTCAVLESIGRAKLYMEDVEGVYEE